MPLYIYICNIDLVDKMAFRMYFARKTIQILIVMILILSSHLVTTFAQNSMRYDDTTLSYWAPCLSAIEGLPSPPPTAECCNLITPASYESLCTLVQSAPTGIFNINALHNLPNLCDLIFNNN